MRFVRNSLALALVCLALLSGCEGLSVDTVKRVAEDVAGSGDTGTAAEDTAEDVADTAPDTAPDTAADTTGDTGVAAANGCGGTEPLAYRGAAASPGDACGLCGDGELFCSGTSGLSCAGASMPNACGGCGLVEGEIGTACGLCGDGVWACGAGQAECVGDRPWNACAGCAPLAEEPGTECLLVGGATGLVVCVGRESSVCASLGTNACGGQGELALPAGVTGVLARPGVRYEVGCVRGVLVCNGEELEALPIEGENGCGGCEPLAGTPGGACGACGGVWTCDVDGGVRCVGGAANACGGCAALTSEPGLQCDAGGNAGITICISLEETACVVPGSTNACGGLGSLTGAALGATCGPCSDGVVVCDGADPRRRSTLCETVSSSANACGGCGILDGIPGSACGTCGLGLLACNATDDGLDCTGNPGASALNACGGCSTLAAAPGDLCGRCGLWGCDPEVVGRLRCDEPAAGCASVAVCGNAAVEAGEACDDGNSVTEECIYGERACSVCDATCQTAAGRASFCGDGALDLVEVCDEGGANGTGACAISCDCSAGYHIESGACLSDTRSCTLANATAATQTWNSGTSSYSSCTATACVSAYHIESGACVSDTRSCVIANGTGTQTWSGGAYGTCAPTSCDASYHIESGACVSDTRSCLSLPLNASAGTESWTGSGYGSCTVSSCNATYHLESGACVSDTRSCSAANATAATESWTGTGYGVCTISACSAGYALVANSCAGGCGNGVTGSGETCDDGNIVTEECAYGLLSCSVCNASCQTAAGETDFCTDGVLDTTEFCDDGNASNADSCNSSCTCGTGYHAEGGVCASNVQACAISFGTGIETWNGGSYGPCTLTGCDTGYHAAGNVCAADVISCSLANATSATQTWNSGTSSYGTCTATACASTYHIESGACVSDTRSCSLANATTATQSWTGSAYGTCTATACASTYHLETGACVSDTRSCVIANATVATQSWNSGTSSYGTCTATACASAFHVESGACLSDTRSCSTADATGSQTWTGSGYGPCSVTPTPGIPTALGDLLVTEVMPRSISGTGDLGEWFEIHNPTTSYWDISTCSWDDNNSTNLISSLTRPSTGANSTIIPPGAYRVFAQSAVSAENHGLTPDFVYDPLISFSNIIDFIRIRCGANLIDDVVWNISSSTGFGVLGKSAQLDRDLFNADANDLLDNWCASRTTYGSVGKFGTPGAANDSCVVTTCDSGYHVESGSCVSDTRSCSIANGTGSQSWTGDAYGTCTPVSCDASYHIESGACLYNTVTNCAVVAPFSVTAAAAAAVAIRVQVIINGVTNAATGLNPDSSVLVQAAYGADGTPPANWIGWTPATGDAAFSDASADAYEASLSVGLTTGGYDFAFRVSGDAGTNWTYCDTTGGTYAAADAGTLTVTPATNQNYTITDCSIAAPTSVTGATSSARAVAALVQITGLTDNSLGLNAASTVQVQLGQGADGSDPSTWTSWAAAAGDGSFSNATSDKYAATLTLPSTVGVSDFAFRVSGDGGTSWTFCDTDGGGYTASAAGSVIANPGFTRGNFLVEVIGDGSTPLSSAGTTITVREYNTTGTLVTAVASAFTSPNLLTDSGTSASQGHLGVWDGIVGVPGYNAALSTVGVVSLNTKAVNLLGSDRSVTSRVAFPTGGPAAVPPSPYSGSNFRSVVPTSATTFYTAGTSSGTPSTGGVWYYNGSSFVQVSAIAGSALTNVKVVGVFGGQLYVSSSSGTFLGIAAVGTGAPTIAGQTAALAVNMGTGASPSGFAFADTDKNGTNDRVYIADERGTPAGGLYRYDLVSGIWTLRWNLLFGIVGGRGLSMTYDAGSATIIVSTSESSNNRLVKVVDASADGSTVPTTYGTLATAGANTVFRGVAIYSDCGDGRVDGAEVCDDGNMNNFDSCTNLCQPAHCGDGLTQSGETCDDGNAVTEECIYGALSCTVCNATCQAVAGATAFCGDGLIDASEVCDEGSSNGAGSCSVACGCATGYHLEGGICANDLQACVITNGTGTETWNGSSYGTCTLTTCDSGYHPTGNACASDLISCSLANATAAIQVWNGSAFGTCTALACASTFHVEAGACVSDTRACSSPNATAATQTWTGSTYTPCTATACVSSYTVVAGACIGSLGTACTLNAECASGFCATGPTGTANDRCAPTGMNFIPSGTFTMGSPSGEVGRLSTETQHSVNISRAFFMGQTEVTQGQWKALSGGLNPSYFQSTTGTGSSTANDNDSGPAEQMDWYAAVAFANARSAAEGLTSCYTLTGCADAANGWKDGIHSGCTGATFAGLTCTGYRLPTESEWEYAARGGTTTATYLGNLSGTVTGCSTAQANLDGIAWWCRNSGSRTQAVGGKTANAFGLSDMLGNVYEWTGDWYGNYPADSVTDPLGAGTGAARVGRGGSWNDDARYARAASRSYATPDFRDDGLGFRLSRTAP